MFEVVKMKKSVIGLIVFGFLLGGCKTELTKTISMNKLLNTPLSTEYASLNVEVAGCNDFNDSRNPSSSLLEAQKEIPLLFENAKFVECYRNKMNSYASFEIPIIVGSSQLKSQQKNEKSDIYLYSHYPEDKSEKVAFGIIITKALKTKLENFKSRNIFANAFNLSIEFTVQNDLKDQNITANVIPSYVNDIPVPMGATINFKANIPEQFKIKLSDVAISHLVTNHNEDSVLNIITDITQ